MERPERREAGGRVPLGLNGPGGRRGQEGSKNDASAEDHKGVAAGATPAAGFEETGGGEGAAELDKFRRRIEAKDQQIRELYDELAAARLASDEAVAKAEANKSRVEDLEEERAQLKERLRAFEEEERGRRRWREGQDRRVARMEREIGRREVEIQRLEALLEGKEEEMDSHVLEAHRMISRKDAALDNALERIEGLQRDLEERENEIAELKETIDDLRAELDLEYDLRRRMAEPENRLRAGIDLFNESEHLRAVDSISKSLGHPDVHVALFEGDEPPVILTFNWGDVAWRTYAANPGLAVEEPRVYQTGAGEGRYGPNHELPNAHISHDGQVLLGL